MSATISLQLTNPSDGKPKTSSATVDVKSLRRESSIAEPMVFLSVTPSGGAEYLLDISTIVRDSLEGRKSTPSAQLSAETFLTGSTVANATVIPVFSVTGFAAGDPIAVKSKQDATDQSYGIVSSVSTTLNQITLVSNGTGLANAYPLGGIVQNLKQRDVAGSRGLGGVQGAKAQLAAPTKPTVTVANSTGNTVDVKVTSASDVVIKSFDLYATRGRLTPTDVIPAHLNPIYQDALEGTGTANLTQYTEDDNKTYNLQTLKSYYVYTVAKDAKGNPKQGSINQSSAVETAITLD